MPDTPSGLPKPPGLNMCGSTLRPELEKFLMNVMPVAVPPQADAPATVILMDHTKPVETARLSLEELPTRCTVGQLHAVLAIPSDTNILVPPPPTNSSLVLTNSHRTPPGVSFLLGVVLTAS